MWTCFDSSNFAIVRAGWRRREGGPAGPSRGWKWLDGMKSGGNWACVRSVLPGPSMECGCRLD